MGKKAVIEVKISRVIPTMSTQTQGGGDVETAQNGIHPAV